MVKTAMDSDKRLAEFLGIRQGMREFLHPVPGMIRAPAHIHEMYGIERTGSP